MENLNIAEIFYPDGMIKLRYSRYMSDDGSRWVRHGLFQSYHQNGLQSSEGSYSHGAETGRWKSFHENGTLAAEGEYLDGAETGIWRYWDSDGHPE